MTGEPFHLGSTAANIHACNKKRVTMNVAWMLVSVQTPHAASTVIYPSYVGSITARYV